MGEPIIVSDIPIPKIRGRGCPRGAGRNQRKLLSIRIGHGLWDVPKKKMECFRVTARKLGIKLLVREIRTNLYYIRRLS